MIGRLLFQVWSTWLMMLVAGCISPDIGTLEFVEVVNCRAALVGWRSIKISAEIINLNKERIEDHGFIWGSTQEELTIQNPAVEKINLGNATTNQIFETNINNLELIPEGYHARAYVVLGERIVYSNTEVFALNSTVGISKATVYRSNDSLIVQGFVTGLDSVANALENHGHVISAIHGSPTIEQDTFSKLGDISANRAFTSVFTNLEFNTQYVVRSYVKTNERTFYSDTLRLSTKDGWRTYRALPSRLQNGIATATATRGYVGMGCTGTSCTYYTDQVIRQWWEFNPHATREEDRWIEKTPFPGEKRIGAVAFAIGEEIYVGLGGIDRDGRFEDYQDFWKFYPQANGNKGAWQKISNFPGAARRDAVAVVVGGKAYVGTGTTQDTLLDPIDSTTYQIIIFNDFYEFDPQENGGMGRWTPVDPLPAHYENQETTLGRADAVAFTLHHKGYVGLGLTNFSIPLQDFWQFDPTRPPKHQWTFKGYFAGAARAGAVGFATADRGFVGIGGAKSNRLFADLWEWNPDTNHWTLRTPFRGERRWQGVGFSIDNVGYVGTGRSLRVNDEFEASPEFLSDWWQYVPVKQ